MHRGVKVIWREQRGEYVLRWVEAGHNRQRSTGLGKHAYKQALQEAAKLESQLSSHSPAEWDVFLVRFAKERLVHLSKGYAATWNSAVSSFEGFAEPQTPDVTAATIGKWAASLQAEGKSPSTIASYVKHLRASLAWGQSVGLVRDVPRTSGALPAKANHRKSRGRPLTSREFARLLREARSLPDGQQWRTYLKGLWLSGLRLSESLQLGWDVTHPIYVAMDRQFPVMMFLEQKSGKEETIPLTPDFAAWLRPQKKRMGYVFKLPSRDPTTVGKTISTLGRNAGIVVARSGKCATAHDLRRSFGNRWAKKLMPAELQKIMRHANIQTTMDYYVDLRADDLARRLYD